MPHNEIPLPEQNPIFTVRPRENGNGYEIVLDPPEYGDVRPTSNFATEADAYAWIKDNYQSIDPPWAKVSTALPESKSA